MHTNLTLMDMIISLILGIAGSILAVYLLKTFPRWVYNIKKLWAERSRASAKTRIALLKEQLSQLDQFEANPLNFVGWCAMLIARAIGAFVTSVAMAIGVIGLRTNQITCATCSLLPDWVSYAGLIMASLIFGYGYGLVGRLIAHNNLDARRKSLVDELNSLKARFHL